VESQETEVEPPRAPVAPKARLWLRILALAAVIGGLWAWGHYSGVLETLTVDRVRDEVLAAGVWGVVLYVAIFVIAHVMHLPGTIFIIAATLLYGPVLGAGLSSVSAALAVAVNFHIVRRVGGGLLDGIERPLLAKILKRLYYRPFFTVLVARVIFMTSPMITTSLALSGIRARDHTAASALGMVPQIIAWSVATQLAL
jgi:uncharacterized membrane protein YdjX (TVP38/TMEM64 family)